MNRRRRTAASLHAPDDPSLLQAIARVAIAHGHLEHVLKMTIRKLAGLTIVEVLDATSFSSMRDLRDRAKKLFGQKCSDEEDRLRFASLLERGQRLSRRRNELIHRPLGLSIEGEWVVKGDDHYWGSAPTVQDLERLADDIDCLIRDLNSSHERGFVARVIRRARQNRRNEETL